MGTRRGSAPPLWRGRHLPCRFRGCAKLRPGAIPCYHTRMGNIPVVFSLEQLQAIVVLANNQLFRVKYIDPKMPGHVNRPEQLEVFKEAVQLVEAALNKAKGIKAKGA